MVEFFTTALIFIFLGMAAILTGGLILIGLPQHSAIPYAVFAALSLLLVLSLRKYARRLLLGQISDKAQFEPGFEDIIGSEAEVISGFSEGVPRGRVVFRGAEWNALCSDALQRGERVKIISRTSHTLTIKKYSNP
jgi:membrane protein implicated in regulation of membrane protease activity